MIALCEEQTKIGFFIYSTCSTTSITDVKPVMHLHVHNYIFANEIWEQWWIFLTLLWWFLVPFEACQSREFLFSFLSAYSMFLPKSKYYYINWVLSHCYNVNVTPLEFNTLSLHNIIVKYMQYHSFPVGAAI